MDSSTNFDFDHVYATPDPQMDNHYPYYGVYDGRPGLESPHSRFNYQNIRARPANEAFAHGQELSDLHFAEFRASPSYEFHDAEGDPTNGVSTYGTEFSDHSFSKTLARPSFNNELGGRSINEVSTYGTEFSDNSLAKPPARPSFNNNDLEGCSSNEAFVHDVESPEHPFAGPRTSPSLIFQHAEDHLTDGNFSFDELLTDRHFRQPSPCQSSSAKGQSLTQTFAAMKPNEKNDSVDAKDAENITSIRSTAPKKSSFERSGRINSCVVCGRFFAYSRGLSSHWDLFHPNVDRSVQQSHVTCNLCTRMFRKSTGGAIQMRKHKEKEHSTDTSVMVGYTPAPVPRKDSREPFVCPCGRKLVNKSLKASHEKTIGHKKRMEELGLL